MGRSTITKRIYCKKAEFLNNQDEPILQNKLRDALLKNNKVGQRKEEQGENNTYVRTIIYHRNFANALFGILASYERGTNQLTVQEDDEAEILTVEQVAPPQKEGEKRSEFLEGVLYFCVFGNHVVVSPSRALRVTPLENHLNWLLEKSGHLNNENRMALSDQVSKLTKEKIRKSHVKQIELGAPFINTTGKEIKIKTNNEKAFQLNGMGIDFLSSIFTKEKMNDFSFIDAVDANIDVTLKIRYSRKTSENAHRLIDNLALSMRDVDHGHVNLELANGSKVKGDELKILKSVNIQARDGIPNPDDLFGIMHAWLTQQLEDGIIDSQ